MSDIIVTKQKETLIITQKSGPNGLNFYSGIGSPLNSFGADSETYLDTTSGDLYKKILGSWVLQSNITGPVGISNFITENRVLTALEIANKELILGLTPITPNKLTVEIQSAPTQVNGIDFSVNTNKVEWSGLAFELLLETGMILIIRYYI